MNLVKKVKRSLLKYIYRKRLHRKIKLILLLKSFIKRWIMK